VRISPDNLFAIELEDEAQHPMRGGMLRAKVDRIVTDLPGVVLVPETVLCSRVDEIWVLWDVLRPGRVGRTDGRALGSRRDHMLRSWSSCGRYRTRQERERRSRERLDSRRSKAQSFRRMSARKSGNRCGHR